MIDFLFFAKIMHQKVKGLTPITPNLNVKFSFMLLVLFFVIHIWTYISKAKRTKCLFIVPMTVHPRFSLPKKNFWHLIKRTQNTSCIRKRNNISKTAYKSTVLRNSWIGFWLTKIYYRWPIIFILKSYIYPFTSCALVKIIYRHLKF